MQSYIIFSWKIIWFFQIWTYVQHFQFISCRAWIIGSNGILDISIQAQDLNNQAQISHLSRIHGQNYLKDYNTIILLNVGTYFDDI